MSLYNSSSEENRLSVNGKNAYIVVSAENVNENKNFYDPLYNKDYLSAKPASNLSVLLKENLSASAPNLDKCDDQPLTPRRKLINTGAIPKITKSATSSKNTEKVLTGMDRYITITKRKSSPRTTKLEPNPKQQKSSSTSQNRYAILASIESETNSDKPLKSYKPPPLYLREATTNSLVSKLTQLVGKENFYVVSLRKGDIQETKIQVNNENNYRTIVNNFDAEKKNYYTYQLKSAKGLVVVIKGIDSSVPTGQIKEALENEGYEVKSIHNIVNKNKIPQPLFRVEIIFNSSLLKKKGDAHPIYGLRYLLNRKIIVEEPIKRKGPIQCLNCQEFGHTKSFCKLPSVCVKCGDIHKSVECPHSKSDVKIIKCSNCGQNHTANYRGCEVYQRLREKTTVKKPVYAQYQDSNFPALPTTSIPQRRSELKQNVKQLSYAQTLKKGNVAPGESLREEVLPTPNENSQNPIESLIQTMNSFMANMQNMLQQLMQNQNMLMQILLSKK